MVLTIINELPYKVVVTQKHCKYTIEPNTGRIDLSGKTVRNVLYVVSHQKILDNPDRTDMIAPGDLITYKGEQISCMILREECQ